MQNGPFFYDDIPINISVYVLVFILLKMHNKNETISVDFEDKIKV
jgi:hypothetical protein